jgi:hypothetical protein
MSQAFLIPLKIGISQSLTVTLDDLPYQLVVRWNDPAQVWCIDLSDGNGNLLLANIPLVTGADLLEQFAYLGIGGQLVVQTTNNALAVPTLANLGDTGNLYFVTSS